MSRRFNRPHRDANQAAITAALHAAGCCVLDLSPLGKGCPDLAVCGGPLGRTWLVEVKNSANWRGRKGTADAHQAEWMDAWPEPTCVLCSVEDALAWLLSERRAQYGTVATVGQKEAGR